MEEIKVGEYVRLDRNQGINKIIDLDDDYYYVLDNEIADEWGDVTCVMRKEELDKDILKHGPNIIDVIEVGDYVNGCNVVDIKNDGVVVSGGFGEIWLSQIENIVTREQFELAKYEVR